MTATRRAKEEPPALSSFGQRLVYLRRLAGWQKASEFAVECGLDRMTIRRAENGSLPGKRAREAIIATLRRRIEAEPAWLIFGEGEPVTGNGKKAVEAYLSSPLAVGPYAPSAEVRAVLRKMNWSALGVANQSTEAIHRLRSVIEINLQLARS